jgi:hypothetical protein
MVALVDDWDSWRRDHEPGETLLVVHGSNEDVDAVNVIAQAHRRAAGEPGADSVRAVDRDYNLHVGDVVMLRNAPYTPPGRPRVENGATGTIAAVDPARDRVAVLMRQPTGHEQLAVFDLAGMRMEAGTRTPALRLAYAMHPSPAQGVTVKRSVALITRSPTPRRATSPTRAPSSPTRSISHVRTSGSTEPTTTASRDSRIAWAWIRPLGRVWPSGRLTPARSRRTRRGGPIVRDPNARGSSTLWCTSGAQQPSTASRRAQSPHGHGPTHARLHAIAVVSGARAARPVVFEAAAERTSRARIRRLRRLESHIIPLTLFQPIRFGA